MMALAWAGIAFGLDNFTTWFDSHNATLINDFSAKQFLKSRLLSGKSTAKELLSQFAAILIYASGNRDFETLTKISALGVKGIKEKQFIFDAVVGFWKKPLIVTAARLGRTARQRKGC